MSFAQGTMSLNDWFNLLNALETIVDRYGLEAVIEAIEHIKLVKMPPDEDSSKTLIGRPGAPRQP